MKTSTLDRNGISTDLVDLVSRLVDLIPWPERRRAMGDVALVLLDGKHRVAEDVFGWGRSVVQVGINEFKTGISCVNDLSTRIKPKTEEKRPELLVEIHKIMEPHSEADSHLRTRKGLRTMTRLLDVAYEKGIKVCGDEKTELEQRLQRSPILHCWDITIQPKTVNL